MTEALATYAATKHAQAQARSSGFGRSWARCRGTSEAATGTRTARERRVRYNAGVSEEMLHAAWRRAGQRPAFLRGRDGHRYRVIYPGRPANGAGPDFRDAVLLRDDGTRIGGHVEIHVRTADWHNHGHTADPAYNGVVLHVVGEDTGAEISTPSGIRIPLLVLGREFVHQKDETPGTGEELRSDALPLHRLDMAEAGREWFRNRVHGYILQLTSNCNQALWEGALECLGYPFNKRGFRQLAARLPWSICREFVISEGVASLQQACMWAAGFGDRPAGAPRLSGKAPEWSRRPGRPANRPQARLSALTAWASQWASSTRLEDAFTESVVEASRPSDLAGMFIVRGSTGGHNPIGISRAREIVVNHLLPAVAALGHIRGDTRLTKHAETLYESHPMLSSNTVTREATRILAARGVRSRPRNAMEQQGLLHIYRTGVASQRPDGQLPLL